MRPSYTTWNDTEWTQFIASVDSRWITAAAPLERFDIVVYLLKRQEEEILAFPQGPTILQRFPANPHNPLFYFQRERWLEAYNKIQFWRQLPGGAEYLKDEVIDGCEQAWAQKLGEWMVSSPEILGLERLQIFSKYPLTRLPPEIGLLKQLTGFMMMNSLLQELPPQFGELVHLKMVFLCNNRLRYLCPEFRHLQQLERLEITNNRLENIDPVGLLKNLEKLNVNKNQIRRLPLQMEWKRLNNLVLGENQLTELPDNLYDVRSLALLWLSQNRLSSISEKISQLSKLDTLFVDKNQLTTLPASLSRLSKLRCLSITHNQITEIPRSLVDAPALIEIQFVGNPISYRPAFLPSRIWTDIK
jgi:hypothetical protein